jgi:ubiquinol oxidase
VVNKILSPDHQALVEEHKAQPAIHHTPHGFSDRFALGFTKLLRFSADTFFAKRYGHRAIVLETVAAVPGMVGATIQHLTCLRRMKDDDGWIRTLMEEAENERMHLMTFIEVAKPTYFERLVIQLAQAIFYVGFFLLYLVSARTAHRVVGYFEEEAVISYTLYLKEIDEGRSPNVPAPAVARLRTHSQNSTVAARAMADRKTVGHRSYRVATRRQSFRRPNMISMRLRLLYRRLS